LLPRQKKANPPNLALPKPNQDQVLLQPNFSHLIFDAFVTIPHQDCTKTITSFFTNFSTKAKKTNPQNLAIPKPNQYQFLLQANFSHLILYAFGSIPHTDFTKTITLLILQFCYQGKKKAIHRTWLYQNQPR